ncbi:MAG: hypothetical protein V2J62_08965 [candidate division KSB1 bacterium]|jgi:nitrogen fixation/metabolism regulation signal transduction histidine kinase|nr:hypothetical protein [candidate division KSB1 bacterium]
MNIEEINESMELFSHKLKNPVHSIGIHVDVVKSKLKKSADSNVDITKHVDFIASETERLQRIVLNYLEYLNLPDGKRKKIDLAHLLEG